jgi:hypothetical protein
LRLKRKNKFSPVYKKSFTIWSNQYPAYKSVVVRRLYEAIKIDRDQKMKPKKLKKKKWNKFCYKVIEEQERKEKRKGGKEIWMG